MTECDHPKTVNFEGKTVCVVCERYTREVPEAAFVQSESGGPVIIVNCPHCGRNDHTNKKPGDAATCFNCGKQYTVPVWEED